jgi:hypothetical protein
VTDEELKTYNNIKIDDVYDEKTDGIGAPPYIYCINNDDNVKKEAKTYSNMDNSYVKNRGKLWGAIDNCKKNYRKTKDKAK